MSKIYYIVYRTTNNVNGKFYIGSHQTKKVNDGYLGSGKYLKKAVKKYGRCNFTRDILAFCIDKEVMRSVESHLVKYYMDNFGQRKCYNRSYSGTGACFGRNNAFYGRKHSEETRRKISTQAKARTGEKNHFFGRKHTNETKEKLKANGKRVVESPDFWLYHWYRNKYWYCTPYGCFISDREAAKYVPWSRSTVKFRCTNADKFVKPNYQIEDEFYHKTWRENGFYLVKRNYKRE